MRVHITLALTVWLALGLATGCATKQKKVLKEVTSVTPVNCITAEGDIPLPGMDVDAIERQAGQGVSRLVTGPPAFDRDGIEKGLDKFANDIMAKV